MKQRIFAWLTRQLWPSIEPRVLDQLIARETAQAAAAQDRVVERADRSARRFIGQP